MSWEELDGLPSIDPDEVPLESPSEYEPEPDEWHGSNVDLGTQGDIDRELVQLQQALDGAMERLGEAELERPALKSDYRMRYAIALASRLKATPSATAAKVQAEYACRDILQKLESNAARKELAKTDIRVLQSQLSAVQTRARMWLAQYEREHYSAPRRKV